MKHKFSESRRDLILKRILLILTASIFVWGIITIINKSDGTDKLIGKVKINVGSDRQELDGHIISRFYIDDEKTYPPQLLREIAVNLPVIKSNPEAGNLISSMNVSFVRDYVGEITYTVFDRKFNIALGPQTNLEIPVDKDDFYYVKIDVKWGKIKNYVAMEYYFAIQLDEIENPDGA